MQQKWRAVLKVLGPVLIVAGGLSTGVIDCNRLIQCLTAGILAEPGAATTMVEVS